MKNCVLILLFLQSTTCAFSQNLGKVDYILIEKKTGSKTIDSKKATLFFSPDSSLFIHSLAKEFGEEDSYWPESVEWFKKKNKDEMGAFIVDPVGQGVYKNFVKKKMQFRKLFLSEAYTVDEPSFPSLKWEIFAETKNFNNIKCQKAVTKFRGRRYTAWFAPSIPIQDGPWKLSGCPGLILEAYDDTDEVLFLFAGIEYPFQSLKKSISPFSVVVKHTFEEFKVAPQIEFEKMKRRSLSSGSSSGVTINRIVNKEVEIAF
jgi:GLPGLI family protein